jgi:4-oxalomesaconate tautomerase
MNLGDVARKNVPKMCLISPGISGGALNTRTFIPRRVHTSIGVLGAISVATACALPGSIAADLAAIAHRTGPLKLDIEHPTGFFTVELEVAVTKDRFAVTRSALLRTARLLMRGEVLVPSRIWAGRA